MSMGNKSNAPPSKGGPTPSTNPQTPNPYGGQFQPPERYSNDYFRYQQSGEPFNQPVMGYGTYGQIFTPPPRRQPPPIMGGKGGGMGYRPPPPPTMGGKGGGMGDMQYRGPQQPPTIGGKGQPQNQGPFMSYPGGSGYGGLTARSYGGLTARKGSGPPRIPRQPNNSEFEFRSYPGGSGYDPRPFREGIRTQQLGLNNEISPRQQGTYYSTGPRDEYAIGPTLPNLDDYFGPGKGSVASPPVGGFQQPSPVTSGVGLGEISPRQTIDVGAPNRFAISTADSRYNPETGTFGPSNTVYFNEPRTPSFNFSGFNQPFAFQEGGMVGQFYGGFTPQSLPFGGPDRLQRSFGSSTQPGMANYADPSARQVLNAIRTGSLPDSAYREMIATFSPGLFSGLRAPRDDFGFRSPNTSPPPEPPPFIDELPSYAEGGMIGDDGSPIPGSQVPPDAATNMEMMLSEVGPANPQAEMSGEYDRLIQMTMQAILGQVEQPDEIIQMFIEEFGVDAFRQLRDAVLKQQVPNAQTEGMVDGNGGGMDDQVMGMIGSQRPVAVSPGEYIVPADVVSGLGDGSSKSGADILDELNQAVRMARTGTSEQPRPLMETLSQ